MKPNFSRTRTALTVATLTGALFLFGCPGEFEEAGENVNNAINNAEDAVDDAADEVEGAVDGE